MLVPVDGGGGALPGDDYDAIEEAVRETRRGRWFLDEFAKRRDTGNTKTILDALAKLERHVTEQQAVIPSTEISRLSGLIARARKEISAAGKSLPEAPDLPEDIRLYERLAEQARDAARLAIRGHDELQDARRSLTAAGVSPDAGEAIDRSAEDLRKLASSQDVLATRLARAMSLMADIDSQLTKYETPEQKLEDKPIAPDSRKFFAPGEALFVPEAESPKPAVTTTVPAVAAQPPAQAKPTLVPSVSPQEAAAGAPKGARLVVRHTAASEAKPEAAERPATEAVKPVAAVPPVKQPESGEKKRIFIVKRPASETVDIPLAEEQAASTSAA